jgi:hypothetical protein
MPTLYESELRAYIRSQLEMGALPLQAENQKVYGGYGTNQRCDVCGERITASDVVYEVEASRSSLLALHRQCFDAWRMESRVHSGRFNSIGSVVVSERNSWIQR